MRVNLETREAHPLTAIPPPAFSDMMPSYAPDGTALAYTRGSDLASREIWIQKLDTRGDPSGKPTRVTEDIGSYVGIAWILERRSILTSIGLPGSFLKSLLVPIGGGSSRVVPLDSIAVWYPTYNAKRHRLAYQRRWMDLDILRFSLDKPDVAPTPVISSTHMDYALDVSPDGKRLVFGSTRDGRPGIWRADRDGANQILLASDEHGMVGSPRWTPDGKWIVYDMSLAGASGIYTVSADGGAPKRVTTTAFKDTRPSVSPDGKWVYFASKASGRDEIWRQPWTGGTRTQLTHNGGTHGMPSPDGRWLYYSRDRPFGAFRRKGDTKRGFWTRFQRDIRRWPETRFSICVAKATELPWLSTTHRLATRKLSPVSLPSRTNIPGVRDRRIARNPRGVRATPRASGE